MGTPNLVGHYRDGLFRRKVEVLSTASTGFNPDFEDSGKLFYLGAASTMFIRLPRASSKHLGINYEFLLQPQSSNRDVNIVTNLDSSARIVGVKTSASTLHLTQSASPATTQYWTHCRMTVVSSIYWLFEPDEQHSNPDTSNTTLAGVGAWTTGTTSS